MRQRVDRTKIENIIDDDQYVIDSEINAMYIFIITPDKIYMRTCQGYIDYTVEIDPAIKVGNEIMQEGIDEAVKVLRSYKALQSIDKRTQERHKVYFGTVIALPIGESKTFPSELIKKSHSNKIHSHKMGILKRNYEIEGFTYRRDSISPQFINIDKVKDEITLTRIK